MTGPTPEARTPSRRRGAKATSAPRPLEAGVASSSVLDAEATSATPTEWVRGGGTGALNQAIDQEQYPKNGRAVFCNEKFIRLSIALLLL